MDRDGKVVEGEEAFTTVRSIPTVPLVVIKTITGNLKYYTTLAGSDHSPRDNNS